MTPHEKTQNELDEKLKVLSEYDRKEVKLLIKLLLIDAEAKGEQRGIGAFYDRVKTT